MLLPDERNQMPGHYGKKTMMNKPKRKKRMKKGK